MSSSAIRVRFAPSPTGYLHVGGLRTALYNFLFARKHHGTFILRIEDTDRSRLVEGAVQNLIDTLQWAGLQFDEGPGRSGGVGPYIQSERLDHYTLHANKLIDKRKAYYCFCTPDRLEAVRKEQEKLKLQPKYDRHCLKLSTTAIVDNLEKKVPYVVRMKVPDSTVVRFNDIIRGDVEFESDRLDDQVLLKSDGYPTYHLANVVDDHMMRISHVIRGEEWLSSTPKHVLLYQSFGWDIPAFAHLPLLLNPDRSKLSKRQGDVAVEDYRTKHYLKEALINFVAFLGWNPGDERELFSLDELVNEFSLERVGKAGAIFNLDKLNWLNFQHLRKKPDAEVLVMLKAELHKSKYAGTFFTDDFLLKIIYALRERVTFITDFIEKGSYFFEPPTQYDPEIVKKRWKPDVPAHLQLLSEAFSKLQNPSLADYEQALQSVAQTLGVSNGHLIHGLRLAVSGVGAGPGVYEILDVIGKEETVRRIQTAIATIK